MYHESMKVFKKILKKYLLLVVVLIGAGFTGWLYFSMQNTKIQSFEDCASAGYPVMESFPSQCMTPDGKSFVQEVSTPSVEPSLSVTSFPSPSSTGKKIRIKGEITCLPHKDTSGPQTMECAHGLKGNDGKYYALRYSDPDSLSMVSLPTGEVVVVEGVIHTETDTKYDIVGGIDVTLVEK